MHIELFLVFSVHKLRRKQKSCISKYKCIIFAHTNAIINKSCLFEPLFKNGIDVEHYNLSEICHVQLD